MGLRSFDTRVNNAILRGLVDLGYIQGQYFDVSDICDIYAASPEIMTSGAKEYANELAPNRVSTSRMMMPTPAWRNSVTLEIRPENEVPTVRVDDAVIEGGTDEEPEGKVDLEDRGVNTAEPQQDANHPAEEELTKFPQEWERIFRYKETGPKQVLHHVELLPELILWVRTYTHLSFVV